MQVYIDKLSEMYKDRLDIVRKNFQPFNTWDESRLKNLLQVSKERILNNDECLVREEQDQSYIYLLVQGKIRVERIVQVESVNYWPQDH